ncbi:MAG: EAL domain-containing protein [Burkholderiales bacterium]|nr:EAL domain-containing protein [Burkholderiales bacterium]
MQRQPAQQRDEVVSNSLTWEPSVAFVRYAIRAILVSVAFVSLAIHFFVPAMKDRALWPVSMAVVATVGWILLRLGKTQAAVASLAIGMWVCVAVMVVVGGGISAPVQYIFPLVIFMLGWLVSTRAAVVIAVLTSVFTVGVVALDAMDALPQAPASPPELEALVQICVFLMAAVLVHSLVRAYQSRLQEFNAVNIDYARRTEDLERTKAELHQAQAVANVGSWVYELATDTMVPSDETCRILGLPGKSTLCSSDYVALAHPDDRERLQVILCNMQQQAGFDFEHRILIGDTVKWVRQKAQSAPTPDGSLTHVLGIVQDINVRKLAELSLQQSEKKFSTAFQSSPVAASIATLQDGRFVEANDKYERDFGWSRTELIGHTTQDIGLWPSREMRRQWVDFLQVRGSIVEYETVWIHKNGSQRDVSISGQIIEYDGMPCILAYATDITERKAAEAQIQKLAFFDSLTGLPNRRLLLNRLELVLAAAQRHRRHGGLLFIDLDNFKTLNDTHGHSKGDILLQQVAQRLNACVREGDSVSRLGGDEFVVMLDNLSEDALIAANQAEVVAEKIRSNLDQSYRIADIVFHNTASIGVTLFGEQSESLEEPLKRADTAMYQAKGAGRNAIRFFDPEMQAAVSAMVELEMDLRNAVTQHQFLLLYQPQINAAGCVIGAEALVRWQHPRRGLVAPMEFIRLAEETDLILPMGAWILETACNQLAQWAHDPGFASFSVSVNVSARQFQHMDFVPQVLGVLQRTGANPERLKLELTESMLIDNVDSISAKMAALKSHGVSFSLDDFGTGYSSLSYLKQLPLDQLKIDRSFVRDVLSDPNDAAIARMVIVLAETLGLAVIAEGVESAEQQALLLGQGCQNFQGYFISLPVPAAQFEEFVRSRP